MKHILYIGYQDSYNFLQQLPHKLPIQLHSVFTLNEAQRKIQQEPYDAYILFEFQPEVLNLVELIHQIATECPIAFITKPRKESRTNYQMLKEDFFLTYVLEDPLTMEEAEALLRSLAKLEEPITLSKITEKIPLKLITAYNQSIYSKLNRLDQLTDLIMQQPSQDNLTLLKQDIHKIMGSAASYGYAKVSELCRLWEARLGEDIHCFQSIPQSSEAYLYNLRFLRFIKLYFQHLYPRYPEDLLHNRKPNAS